MRRGGLFALEYHNATKHHFDGFAQSLGYLDWATQPDPFRRYAPAPLTELPRAARLSEAAYEELFSGRAQPAPVTFASVGELFRCSMGLSAWKEYGRSRWALRVNPSSGNLHPTEAYLVWDGRIWHYAPREHGLEERAVLDPADWARIVPDAPGFLVGLTSVHWREAWKYGERAFRYCQHDAGHAIGALRFAAAMLGWRLTLAPGWSDLRIAGLLGLDRDGDSQAEREEPECVAIVAPARLEAWAACDPESLVEAAQRAAWCGTPNRLSRAHAADWAIIERVSASTRWDGNGATVPRSDGAMVEPPRTRLRAPADRSTGATARQALAPSHRVLSARSVILQRRSAVAFDGQSRMAREQLTSMLRRLLPAGSPWDAIDWAPHVHLALFVHRVDGLEPGIYAYLRAPAVLGEWRAAMRPEFLWEPISDPNDPNDPNGSLFLLLPIDCRHIARRLSCDQDIAADGFFSLGMIARVASTLREPGEWFYRRLFWECGIIGQVLYLEAEAAGARATGIGCFYDDPVHEVLGLSGHEWQSLYHFSMGAPVEDTRLKTEPGYAWESGSGSSRGAMGSRTL